MRGLILVTVLLLLVVVSGVKVRPPSAASLIKTVIKSSNGSPDPLTVNVADSKLSEECERDWQLRSWAALVGDEWAARMTDADGRRKSGVFLGAVMQLGSYDGCNMVKATYKSYSIGNRTWTHNFNAKYFKTLYMYDIDTNETQMQWIIATCAPDTCSALDISQLRSKIDGIPVKVLASESPEVRHLEDHPEAIATICLLGFFGVVFVLATLLDYKWQSDAAERKVKPERPVELAKQTNGQQKSNGHQHTTSNGIDNRTFECAEDKKVVSDSDVMVTSFKMVTEEKASPVVVEVPQCMEPKSVPVVAESEKRTRPIDTDGKLKKSLLAFSLYRTIPSLTSTKSVSGAFNCINGVRFLSMCWIVMGHTYQLGTYVIPGIPYTVADNYIGQFDMLGKWHHATINEMSIAVDTFFVLSGCLVTISFMKALERQGGNPTVRQIVLYYVHRYWRLTPVYLILLMVWACLFRFWISGPNLPNYWGDVEFCAEDWWTHVIYVNNIFGRYACFGWSWYLANDFQFYVFSPLVLIPLYKWPKIGVSFLILCIMGSVASSAYILTYVYERKRDQYVDFYIRPWCRYASYGIGTALGYIMYRTKCKIDFSNHSKTKLFFMVGWLCGAFLLLFPVFSTVNSNWVQWTWVLNESVRRYCFGLGVAWLVFACASGYGGFINTFLSWKFLLPLSKLSYVGYLIHIMVIYFFYYNSHHLIYVNNTNMLFYSGGVLLYTIGLSFIISLVFEIPMLTLEKIFIPKAKKH